MIDGLQKETEHGALHLVTSNGTNHRTWTSTPSVMVTTSDSHLALGMTPPIVPEFVSWPTLRPIVMSGVGIPRPAETAVTVEQNTASETEETILVMIMGLVVVLVLVLVLVLEGDKGMLYDKHSDIIG